MKEVLEELSEPFLSGVLFYFDFFWGGQTQQFSEVALISTLGNIPGGAWGNSEMPWIRHGQLDERKLLYPL